MIYDTMKYIIAKSISKTSWTTSRGKGILVKYMKKLERCMTPCKSNSLIIGSQVKRFEGIGDFLNRLGNNKLIHITEEITILNMNNTHTRQVMYMVLLMCSVT